MIKTAAQFIRRVLGNPNPLNQPTIPVTPDGWILFTSAQPAFGVWVLVKSANNVIGLGLRTKEVDPEVGQEVWKCVLPGGQPDSGIVAWRLLP
jgi:hypothetical protein